MRTRLAWLAVLGTFVLAACGGDDEVTADAAPSFDTLAPIDATPPPPTLDELCNQTDGLLVQYFAETFSCQADLFELLFGASLPDNAELNALCEGALGPYLDDGTVELGDRAAFDACAAYLANLDCADVAFDAPTPCDDVLVGTIAEGNDCDSSDQCAGDAYCDGAGVTCGTCTAKKANDEVCSQGSECLTGYCKEVSGGNHVCAPLGVNGDDCTSSQDCLGTRVCNTSGKCATAPASWSAGDPCTTFVWDCGGPASDLYCNPSTQQCQQWLAVDDACVPMTTDLCDLFAYETCQDPGGGAVCTAPTVESTAGNTCGFTAGIKCDTGMRCNADTSVCETVVALGGDCSGANTTCEFLLSCVDGTCQYGGYSGMCPAP